MSPPAFLGINKVSGEKRWSPTSCCKTKHPHAFCIAPRKKRDLKDKNTL